jgi:hypothetical protein
MGRAQGVAEPGGHVSVPLLLANDAKWQEDLRGQNRLTGPRSRRRHDALDQGGTGREIGGPWRAHIGIAVLADLLNARSQALAGRVLDDEPRSGFLEGRLCVRDVPQSPESAVVWSVDEKSGMQAKSRVNPTKAAIPAAQPDGSSSTSATAPPCSLLFWTSTMGRRRGWVTVNHDPNSSEQWPGRGFVHNVGD